MREGSPRDFTHELHVAGYMTADEATYAKTLEWLANDSLPLCEQILAGQTVTFTDEQARQSAALVSLTVANDLIWMPDRHEELAA
jgi:hypothetical protein